jgi:Flp pilus assembly pilin Flp
LSALGRLLTGESGADSSEYALLAALLTVMLFVVVAPIGAKLNGALNAFGGQIPITIP